MLMHCTLYEVKWSPQKNWRMKILTSSIPPPPPSPLPRSASLLLGLPLTSDKTCTAERHFRPSSIFNVYLQLDTDVLRSFYRDCPWLLALVTNLDIILLMCPTIIIFDVVCSIVSFMFEFCLSRAVHLDPHTSHSRWPLAMSRSALWPHYPVM